MTRVKPILVLACLFVVVPIALAACPSREDVAPCTCQEGTWGVGIKCNKMDDKDLTKVARSLRGMRVYKFHIENSQLGFIPNDVFIGVQIKEFSIERSSLSALTDRGEALVGLESHLEELSIWNCAFKNKWDWSVLRNLKKLKRLTIVNSLQLDTLGTDAMKVSISSGVKYFFFSRNNISSVSDYAFDSFKNLTHLVLNNHKIRIVKRTMLPNPALELTWLTISGNLIEQIPRDMFTKMSRLQHLDISDNKILVLNERTFSPVWEELQYFSVIGNPLRCDCSMYWLVEERTPNNFNGKCASPPELQGKELTKLTSKDLVCYV